jgi:hypothetical protein
MVAILIGVRRNLLKNYYYCCSGWGYIVAFTKVLTMYQTYYIWIHTLPLLSFITLPQILGTVSTGIIFAFTYICIHYLHNIHPVRWNLNAVLIIDLKFSVFFSLVTVCLVFNCPSLPCLLHCHPFYVALCLTFISQSQRSRNVPQVWKVPSFFGSTGLWI